MLTINNSSVKGCSPTDFGSISSLLDAVDFVETRRLNEGRHRIMHSPADKVIFSDYSMLMGQTSEDDSMEEPQDRPFPPCTSRKGTRKRIHPSSVKILTDLFNSGVHFPSRDHRERLSQKLSLSSRTIQIWFQNRRQAFKNKRQSQMSLVGKGSERPVADENMAPILMTKLRYDKHAHQLVETKSALRIPSYIAQAPITTSRSTVEVTRQSDDEPTRIEVKLPRPPAISKLSPIMQCLPRDLPRLKFNDETDLVKTSIHLPSICQALRRFSC